MEIAKRLEGIGEYYFSQKLREIDELNKQGKQVINLGIGSPDLPPHPEVIKVLQDEIVQIKQVFPFTIEANIKDDEWVSNESAKLKEELERLKTYEEELTLQYQNMISLL